MGNADTYLSLFITFYFLGLTTTIEGSYSPQPKVVLMKEVLKSREWLAESIEEIHRQSEPLCFKFELDESGQANIHSSRWSDTSWKNHGHLLKVRT